MKRTLQLLIGVVFIFSAHITTVSALTINYVNTYTQSLTATGSGSSTALIQPTESATPFDPSFGTLETIDIIFNGTAIFSIYPGVNLTYGEFGRPIYVQTLITPTFTIDIDGFNGFYEFGAPATLSQQFTSTGQGVPIIDIVYDYSFTFNYHELAQQFIGPNDVSGGMAPPILITGDLTDFIDSETLVDNLLFTYELSFLEALKVSTTATTVTVDSSLSVDTTYTYTTPVPEPSTLLLFGTGLVGIGIFRRKFKG